ncbi:MAG: hypothetical protein JKY37_16525 [Nannocystaceae bacterium]|nr:hypothetical protein [Nannocystaceae bacterium]
MRSLRCLWFAGCLSAAACSALTQADLSDEGGSTGTLDATSNLTVTGGDDDGVQPSVDEGSASQGGSGSTSSPSEGTTSAGVDGGTVASTDEGGSAGTTSNGATSNGATSSGDTSSSDDGSSDSASCDEPLGTTENCGACGEVCGGSDVCTENACTSSRRVFLSSAQYNGNLGGVTGADEACQTLADAATLGGLWRAYIIDSKQGLSRHSMMGGPYLRMDGMSIANDWTDLSDESIGATLNIDESGNSVGGNVWTGLDNVVGAFTHTCSDWTYDGPNCLGVIPCGAAGESGTTDEHWDGFWIFDCDSLYRLYCIEQ